MKPFSNTGAAAQGMRSNILGSNSTTSSVNGDKAFDTTHTSNKIPSYNRSPSLDGGSSSYSPIARDQQNRLSITQRSSTDLLGQRFDSAAVISNLDAICYSTDYTTAPSVAASSSSSQPSPNPGAQQSQPPRLQHSYSTGTTPQIASTSLTLSQSLGVSGRKMDDINTSRLEATGARSARQRYSDEEVKESKFLRKKSGLSTLLNNLVGSPRRPAISAPENPVHVTHVGYDQETGEFTVCSILVATKAGSALRISIARPVN